MRPWNLRTCLSVSIAVVLMGACGGGSDDSGDSTSEVTEVMGIDDTYLFITYQSETIGKEAEDEASLYYGTQDVGTVTDIDVRIANRGADIYPLSNFAVTGDNADEFSTDFLEDITLGPAEFVNINVAFQPITEGQKSADFSVDYDTIQVADDADNLNELSYYEANELEVAGQFRSASKVYEEYLANDPVTINERRAAIRLPIIDEAQNYDIDDEMVLYLEAMSHRDYEEYALAVRTLDTLVTLYPDSYLADDALYLKAYIQLIDLNDPASAVISMQAVRSEFPDTTYYDTSLYSEATAQIELGNVPEAETILQDLKSRHTGIDALGIQLPKDNLISRMWFDRAAQVLESV